MTQCSVAAGRWRTAAFGATTDQGLRTLAGGQISVQVEGYLAMQTDATPPLVIEDRACRRGIFSRWCGKRQAEARSYIAVAQNSTAYCTLTIADGQTTSNVVDGFGLAPLAASALLDLDITVGADSRGNIAGARSDSDDPTLELANDRKS